MAGVISGYEKVDLAVANASSGWTTPYYDMGMYDKAIFICCAGSMSASGTIALSGYQATSSTGANAQVTGHYTTMGSTSALACNIDKASAVVIRDSSLYLVGPVTLEINGVTFTMATTLTYGAALTTATFETGRYVMSSSGGTSSTECIEHLAAYINHATYGCTGLLAVCGAATYMTIVAIPPGEEVITCEIGTSTGGQMQSLRTVGIVEMHAAELTAASSMRYAAVAGVLGAGETVRQDVVLVRSGARFSPDTQNLVGAYVSDI